MYECKELGYDINNNSKKEKMMEHCHFLINRNRMFLACLIGANLLYSLSFFYYDASFLQHFSYTGLIFIVISVVFFVLPISPCFLQYFLLIGSHCSVLAFIFLHPHYINALWVIMLFALVSIYQSLRLSIISFIVLTLEMLFIFLQVRDVLADWHFASFYFFILTFCFMLLAIALHIKSSWGLLEANQKQLASQQAYLHLFFESANDSIAVFDLQQRVITVNPAFETLYGWTKEECIGKTIATVPTERQQEAKERHEALLKGKSFPGLEVIDQRKDGSYFNALITLSPIFNDDGQVMATSVISRDISYLKENERLTVQSEKLKIAGELAAGMAHEIRNPMTVISGFTQMMVKDKQSPYHAYATIINDEINRIDLIIEEFLILSKPHLMIKEPFALEAIVEEVCALMQESFLQQHVQSHITYEPNCPKIIGNKNQLKQVFVNIIKNAMEAMEQQVHKQLNITIKETAKHEIAVIIEDNGEGISPDILAHIYEPFFTTKVSGTGLGMIISNKIMREHHGYITIDTTVNKGTTITLTFPIL